MPEIQECLPGRALIGNSPAIRQIRDQLQKTCRMEVPVLITGESGTGKGLAAKLLHDMSERRAHRFLKLSCATLSSQYFEGDLESDANHHLTERMFERPITDFAIGGSIFVDEIGELDLTLQSKLLHQLQDSNLPGFSGVADPVKNVRLICATNRNLEFEVAIEAFRADLYFRISVLRIHMPPLRDCILDVPVLMKHFIRIYSEKFGKTPPPLSPSFRRVLEGYHWPGNTRELENMAKGYVLLGGEDYVLSMIRHPQRRATDTQAEVDLRTPLRIQTKRAVKHLENKIILEVLKAHNWNRRKTARSLDISYRTLLYKIKEGGLARIE